MHGRQLSADFLTERNFKKLYFFYTILDEDNFYIKTVGFDEIYNL